MHEYIYKGSIVTANSKREAINKVIEGSFKITASVLKSVDYDDPNVINYYRSNAC